MTPTRSPVTEMAENNERSGQEVPNPLENSLHPTAQRQHPLPHAGMIRPCLPPFPPFTSRLCLAPFPPRPFLSPFLPFPHHPPLPFAPPPPDQQQLPPGDAPLPG
ncbi:inverted formin-2-like [Fopius arisanus]|uniref:Inverted formin-2-like n=1 Tax=Fopius arisanus TaxID=64838 RepID=A0A9R1U8X7_9HYME|nr:PREDICTED: inverted formin-2-like [Fopius arisanus]